VSGNSASSSNITFSESYSTAPNVTIAVGSTDTLGVASGNHLAVADNIDTSGFTARVYNGAGGSLPFDKCGYFVIGQ
jgi:hypothetical protein